MVFCTLCAAVPKEIAAPTLRLAILSRMFRDVVMSFWFRFVLFLCSCFLLSKGDGGEGSGGAKFGHLHVVFRDWNYSGTAEEVGTSEEAFFLARGRVPAHRVG